MPEAGAGRSLDEAGLVDLVARVERAAAARARRYPGDAGGRQPVHTVYVAADRFAVGTAAAHGAEALRLLDAHAPGGATLAAALGLDDQALAAAVRERVAAKLVREPVEDLRIDFEDGYGVRDDAEEDRDAARAAAAVAEALAAGTLPPFAGPRVKSFADGQHRRPPVGRLHRDGPRRRGHPGRPRRLASRVRAFHAGAPGPGGVLDEPATVKALIAQVRRAVHCGAVPETEALARTGLDRAALLGG